MNWRTIGVLAAALTGCATPPATRTFADPPEKVRSAVLEVLARCHDVIEEGNVIRTGNCPSPLVSGDSPRFGKWRERHEITLEGSTVEIRSIVEQGMGRRAPQWDRRPARDTQEKVLEAIAQALKKDQ